MTLHDDNRLDREEPGDNIYAAMAKAAEALQLGVLDAGNNTV